MAFTRSLISTIIFGVFFFFNCSAFAAVPMKLIKFWDDVEPQSLINVDHSAFKEVLNAYISDQHPSGIARFNFNAVSELDKNKLKGYLDYLQLLEPRQLNEAEAKAYWVNLYNAATLKMVLEAYDDDRVKSIREARTGVFSAQPWKRKLVTISQQKMSLEEIHNGVLRPMYKDHRLHFALFFFSLGGPDVSSMILEGENNDEVLDTLEKNFFSHYRAARLNGSELVLSELFETYDTDFAENSSALIQYISQHVSEEIAAGLLTVTDIRFEYDWSINTP